MEDLSLLKAGLAIVAGILAGIINTLAGSGSTITLPMLVFLGVPAHEANATNRIGVAFQNTAAVITLRSRKALDMDGRDWWLTGAMVVGSVGGAAIAAELSEQVTNWVIVVILAVVLITILWKPEKWLREQSEPVIMVVLTAKTISQWEKWLQEQSESVMGVRPSLPQLFLFALIGAYGGFIQAGVGLFILSGMVLVAGSTMVKGNILKLVAVLVFTLAAMAVFMAQGVRMWWYLGLILAVGQSIGAWLAARFMTGSDMAKVWMRWLLIVVICYSIVQFSGLQNWLLQTLV